MKKSLLRYEELVNYTRVLERYLVVMKNTEHKGKLVNYNLFLACNLMGIYQDLKNGCYRHGKYHIFLIKDPKYRIIMSENLKDKIVNQMVSEYLLKPVLEPRLIDSNTATRKGMGGRHAFDLCKRYLVKLKRENREIYVLKFDIKKYFYHIDHDVLMDKLKRVFFDQRILSLLRNIIDSSNYSYVNQEIDLVIEKELKRSLSFEHYEELKRIPHYQYHKGLAIGNVTSQILAIYYLNDLDHYIKEKLGCKYYICYMDDGIIFDYEKERLKKIKGLVEEFLKKERLTLNKKTNIYKVRNGFTFIGYRFFIKKGKLVIRITNKVKVRIKRKIKNLSIYDQEKLMRVKASYYGYLKRASTGFLQFSFKIKGKN